MSEKEKIISRIKQNMGEIKKFGVKKIGIFGSCARDEIGNIRLKSVKELILKEIEYV